MTKESMEKVVAILRKPNVRKAVGVLRRVNKHRHKCICVEGAFCEASGVPCKKDGWRYWYGEEGGDGHEYKIPAVVRAKLGMLTEHPSVPDNEGKLGMDGHTWYTSLVGINDCTNTSLREMADLIEKYYETM